MSPNVNVDQEPPTVHAARVAPLHRLAQPCLTDQPRPNGAVDGALDLLLAEAEEGRLQDESLSSQGAETVDTAHVLAADRATSRGEDQPSGRAATPVLSIDDRVDRPFSEAVEPEEPCHRNDRPARHEGPHRSGRRRGIGARSAASRRRTATWDPDEPPDRCAAGDGRWRPRCRRAGTALGRERRGRQRRVPRAGRNVGPRPRSCLWGARRFDASAFPFGR